MNNPLDKQVGGDYYKHGIQPVEYAHSNGLGFCEGCVIKYVTRHRQKNGKEDLLKAIHFIELLIRLEYETEVDEHRSETMAADAPAATNHDAATEAFGMSTAGKPLPCSPKPSPPITPHYTEGSSILISPDDPDAF